ncbi:hypothetical protein EWM64_g2404 [Hericium alpestre]|uniref:Vta1/callose synthase N-terminal domain-containing protein n=1 Tax=Hericium alpestre TaxID=135208 RepID=A0A4Z0A4H4_9AGAM|nr:hypothetical protein EWM64_g2404 [Hericium alpestre]
MSTSYLGLPPIPADLKPLTPFLQRADELKSQEPVISYWCIYHAAQIGISLRAPSPANRAFLSALLTALESLRSSIGSHDAVDIESVSTAYVENFALRVFASADNEDRSGRATRGTAKKFVAASNFLEVLKVFEDKSAWESHEEKVRYAKWKAADIAKAFREGRKPTAGPADATPPPEVDQSPLTQLPSVPSQPHAVRTPSPPRHPHRDDFTHVPSASPSTVTGATPPFASHEYDQRARVSGELEGKDREDEGFYETPRKAVHFPPPSSSSVAVNGSASTLSTVGEEPSAPMPISRAHVNAGAPSGRDNSPPSSLSSASSTSSRKSRRSWTTSLNAAQSPPAPTAPSTGSGKRRSRTGSLSSATSPSGAVHGPPRPSSPTHFVPRSSPPSSATGVGFGSSPPVPPPPGYVSAASAPPVPAGYAAPPAVYVAHPTGHAGPSAADPTHSRAAQLRRPSRPRPLHPNRRPRQS